MPSQVNKISSVEAKTEGMHFCQTDEFIDIKSNIQNSFQTYGQTYFRG